MELGLSERLQRSLTTTNAAESLISRTWHVKRNVKRWRGGKMMLRRVAAGILEAAKGFRWPFVRAISRSGFRLAAPWNKSRRGIELETLTDEEIVPTSAVKFKEGWAMSVLCEAVVVLLLALPAVAQSQAFEAISIKPARSGEPRNMRMRVLPNGDLIASAVPVLLLLSYAYDVPVNPSPRLSGLPDWRERYDIEAKAPANAVSPGLPESEKRSRIQRMIRGLLADRFKLVMRVQQKPMPVYALTVASGGPNLQKSTIPERDCIFDTGTPESCHNFIMGRGHPLHARAINMDDVVQYIENWTDLPVVNRTAVSGLFAVETEGWTPMRLPPPPPGNPPAVRFDDLPTLFTVLRTLGLELKQQTATVPVYTVEHIERPAAE